MMEKINRILVPTDFSEFSEGAVDQAVSLARRLNATILLVHVMESIGYPVDFVPSHPWSYTELKIGQMLDRVAHSGRKEGISVETHLLKGDPAVEIVKTAQNLGCDMIVMGTHGRSGITHLLMGSVAEKVIRTAPIPVLIVSSLAAMTKVEEEEKAFKRRVQGGG